MGLLRKIFDPFGVGFKRPPKEPEPPISVAPAAELPYTFDGLARQFPQWKDDIFDTLGKRQAYQTIRRCDVTAQPMRKFAGRVAMRELTVVGQGERRDQLQEIIDHALGVPQMLEWLSWAHIEGVRFVALKGKLAGGWIVPDFRQGGRYKAKAGGVLEWDGANIVEQQRTQGIVTPETAKAKTWDRFRFLVHCPSASSNFEGDGDLAWMLYLIAHSAQENDKNQDLYSDRFGVPIKMMRTDTQGLRPDLISARIVANASKLDEARHGGTMGMSAKELADILEPSGSTSEFLAKRHAQLEARAHKLILQNILTSETAASGPTGSSAVHKSEEDMAVELLAGSLSETLTSDLLPFIDRYNSARLAPPEGMYYIAVSAEDTERQITPAEAQTFAAQLGSNGIAVDAQWYFGAHGAPLPDGIGTSIVIKPAPTQSIFGGASSIAPSVDRASAQPPANPANPAKVLCPVHGPLRAAVLEVNELDAIVAAAMKVLTPVIVDAYWALADKRGKGKLSKAASDAILKARALADLAGRARFLREIGPSIRKKLNLSPLRADTKISVEIEKDLALAPAEAVKNMAARLAIPAETAMEVAAVYTAGNFAAVKAVTKAMADQIKNKLEKALAEGIPQKDFTKWMQSVDGDAFPEAYANTVYRTNMNEAYSAGRLQQLKEIEDEFIGWRYETAGDDAVRAEHAALDGKVFSMDATDLMPPLGFNCRCTWVPIENGENVGELADPQSARASISDADSSFLHTPGGDIYPEK